MAHTDQKRVEFTIVEVKVPSGHVTRAGSLCFWIESVVDGDDVQAAVRRNFEAVA